MACRPPATLPHMRALLRGRPRGGLSGAVPPVAPASPAFFFPFASGLRRSSRRSAAATRPATARRSTSVPKVQRGEARTAQLRRRPVLPDDLAGLRPALAAASQMLRLDVTADACLTTLEKLRPLLGQPRVSEADLRQVQTTADDLHTVAVLLLASDHAAPDGSQHVSLASVLLHLAGGAVARPGGHLPSTLTVISMFGPRTAGAPALTERQAAQHSRVLASAFYGDAEKRFLAYLAAPARADDAGDADAAAMRANAFTHAGLLAEADDPARALRWLRAARDAGPRGARPHEPGSRAPRWDWERRCLEGIGRVQMAVLRDGDSTDPTQADALYRDARAAVRTAALELDSGAACLLLATDYAARTWGQDTDTDTDTDADPDAETLLYRAAAGGTPGACAVIAARLEAAAAADRPGHLMGPDDLRRLAKEWRTMADAR